MKPTSLRMHWKNSSHFVFTVASDWSETIINQKRDQLGEIQSKELRVLDSSKEITLMEYIKGGSRPHDRRS